MKIHMLMTVSVCLFLAGTCFAQAPFPPNWSQTSYYELPNAALPNDMAVDPTTGIPHILFKESTGSTISIHEVWREGSTIHNLVVDSGDSMLMTFTPQSMSIKIDNTGKVAVVAAGVYDYVWTNNLGQQRLAQWIMVWYNERSATQDWTDVNDSWRKVYEDNRRTDQDMPLGTVFCDLQFDRNNRGTICIGSIYLVSLYNNVTQTFETVQNRRLVVLDSTAEWHYWYAGADPEPPANSGQGLVIFDVTEVDSSTFNILASGVIEPNPYDSSAGTNSRFGAVAGFNNGSVMYWSFDRTPVGEFVARAPVEGITANSAVSTSAHVTSVALAYTPFWILTTIGVPHIAYTWVWDSYPANSRSFFTSAWGNFSVQTPIGTSTDECCRVGGLMYSQDYLTVMATLLHLEPDTSNGWDGTVTIYKVWQSGTNMSQLLRTLTTTAKDGGWTPVAATVPEARVTTDPPRYHVSVSKKTGLGTIDTVVDWHDDLP